MIDKKNAKANDDENEGAEKNLKSSLHSVIFFA